MTLSLVVVGLSVGLGLVIFLLLRQKEEAWQDGFRRGFETGLRQRLSVKKNG